jgi:hypothetical protein
MRTGQDSSLYNGLGESMPKSLPDQNFFKYCESTPLGVLTLLAGTFLKLGPLRSDSEWARWKRDGRWVCEIRELAPGESMIIASDTMALPEGLAKGSGFDSLS